VSIATVNNGAALVIRCQRCLSNPSSVGGRPFAIDCKACRGNGL